MSSRRSSSALKKATSESNNNTIQRIVDLLIESSRTSKEKLDEEHKGHITWLTSALRSLKCRILGETPPTDDQDSEADEKSCAQQPKRAKDNQGRSKGTNFAEDVPGEESDVPDDDSTVVARDRPAVRAGSKRKLGSMSQSKVVDNVSEDEDGGDGENENQDGATDGTRKIIPSTLRVVDLRRELRARGLPSSGLKAQLIEKLQEALEMEELEGEKEPELPEIMECDEEDEDRSSTGSSKSSGSNKTAAPPVPMMTQEEEQEENAKEEKKPSRSKVSAASKKASGSSIRSSPSVASSNEDAVVDIPITKTDALEKSSTTADITEENEKEEAVNEEARIEDLEPSAIEANEKNTTTVRDDDDQSAAEQAAAVVDERREEASAVPSSSNKSTEDISSTSHAVAPVVPTQPSKSTPSTVTASTSVNTTSTLSTTSSGSSTTTAPTTTATTTTSKSSVRDDISAKISALRKEQMALAERNSKLPSTSTTTTTQPLSFLERLKLTTSSLAKNNSASKAQANKASATSLLSSAVKSATSPRNVATPASSSSSTGSTLQASSAGSTDVAAAITPAPPNTGVVSSSSSSSAGQRAQYTSSGGSKVSASAISEPLSSDENTFAPTSAEAHTSTAAGVSQPSNLVADLHSFTSLVKKTSETIPAVQSSAPKVEVKALKRAEAARKADLAKEEERRQRKAMMEKTIQQKKLDASRLEQEANKKRAELAAKRKEREEKLGEPNPSSSTSNAVVTGSSKLAEEIKKPRLDFTSKVPAANSSAAASRTMEPARKQPLAPTSNTSVSRPPPLTATSSSAATRPVPTYSQAAPLNSTALKDISHKTNLASSTTGSNAAEAAAGTKINNSSEQSCKQPIGSRHSAAVGASAAESYEISDRDDSSDDDYDSDGGKKVAKKVPDWARGPALREALEQQFNKKQRIDPDNIFPEVRTCDLEEIFKSFQGQTKKRSYRNRQSTGNWKKDALTSAEKLRYKEEMGYH